MVTADKREWKITKAARKAMESSSSLFDPLELSSYNESLKMAAEGERPRHVSEPSCSHQDDVQLLTKVRLL